jgi:hypothetical protein
VADRERAAAGACVVSGCGWAGGWVWGGRGGCARLLGVHVHADAATGQLHSRVSAAVAQLLRCPRGEPSIAWADLGVFWGSCV